MRNIFEKVQELDGMPSLSKHEQLVQGIINAIDEKIIAQGDPLPSINTLIHEIGFARETVMKAYRELISRGIVEAKNRMGYFVANINTNQQLKVALLMYAIDTFQDQFYQSFRNELGPDIHLDVFFHHGNIEVFETMISLIKGKYGMYAIAPIPHPKTSQLLAAIPKNKFVMFDRLEKLDGEFNYVVQEFEKSSYAVFVQLLDAIKQFDEMIFFHMPGSLVPIEIVKSYLRFIKDYKINGKVLAAFMPGSVEKGKVYYTNDSSDLYRIIKDCRMKNLVPGKDVGILSHNDEPVKEIIFDGITTYSTDFTLMGKRAARFIIDRKPIQEIIPTALIRRKSL